MNSCLLTGLTHAIWQGRGLVAGYIPALAQVDINKFGVAMATVDGSVFSYGDAHTAFSMQSISKVFSLLLATKHVGDALWTRVGREPSGSAFNSLVQLEYENGIPRNPFINAGAIVVSDVLQQCCASGTSPSNGVLDFLRKESGNQNIFIDEIVAKSEAETGFRNYALANFMKSMGNIQSPVDTVLTEYFRQCSIAISCADLATAGLILARHGRDATGAQYIKPHHAKRVQAIMMTCGTYDAAGEIAYTIGLPCKSGVGGGILAIFPRVGSVAVWGPGLDPKGNTVAGVEFLRLLTKDSEFSVF